ncbi:N-acetylglucosamine-6-phosphate deacetylase [Thermatribacter velox]|uniref:N-acetylglucosamine-6-phosphate deacetylase n=1 Tax=Thermatribacter velox TaxID=3039681 RepID=A0ABZ2Y8Y9_9BACT
MKKESFIAKGQLVTPYGVFKGSLLIKGDIIEDVHIGDVFSKECEGVFDFGDAYLFPGLIDLHIHGAVGEDFMDGSPEGIERITTFLLQHGVTRFLATTLTESKERTERAIEAIVSCKKLFPSILGIHLEGPYLSPERRGAQNASFLRKPDLNEIKEFIALGEGLIKRVTIAPELDNALDIVEYLASQDILVSLGHSTADYRISFQAFLKGARLVTHLFNGMDPLHHRSPNLLAFALGFEGICVEMIADLIHVSPEIMKIALLCKRNRLILISDAIRATGLQDGMYEMGGEMMEMKDGIARMVSTGSLAGSTLTLDQALYNLKQLFDLSLPELARMASLLPAKLLKIDDRLGSLEKNKIADIVVFDENFRVQGVFLAGEKIF